MSDLTLVDTDVLIEAARGSGDATRCIARIERRSALAVSLVTQMELICGCGTKREMRALDRFLSRYFVVRIDERMSGVALDLLARYRLSHGLLLADALIAAASLVINAPFVTRNRRHYRFIAGLKLLPYPSTYAS